MTVRTPAKVITEYEQEEDEPESSVEDETNSNDDESSDAETEGDSNDELEDADNEMDENEEGNSGWADALAKVLQQEKPKNKKYLVLSKAKKLADRKEKNEANEPSFEVLKKEGEVDEEPVDTKDEVKPSKEELEWASTVRKEKNNKLQELRVAPSQMNNEREKSFKRIAQRGVVQLFNAVRAQQRDLVDQLEKAGPLDHKRDEVLNNINKRKFLDMLMGSKRAKSENVDNPVKTEDSAEDPSDSKPSQWSVLRDDFMTNKSLSKHWANDDSDDEGGSDIGIDDNDQLSNSDSDSD